MPKNTAIIILLLGFFMGFLGQSHVPAAQNPLTYAISVETVLQQAQANQDLILVDVREQRQFDQFNIPGALNISLFALKTKAFLKNKSLILIDEGYRPSHLQAACEQLRKSGFEAWFLHGGLNAWSAHGAPLQGNVFAQKALNRMPPQQFFTEQDSDNWLVIDVSVSDNQEVQSLLPHVVSVPYQNHEQAAFLAALNKTVEQHHKQPWLSVLICDARGEDYTAIEQLIQQTDIKHVFFLKGGIHAYREFLSQQARIRQGKQQGGTRQPISSGCPSCN